MKIKISTRSNAFKCRVFGQWFSLGIPSKRGREIGRSLGTNVSFGPVLKYNEDLAQGMDSKFIVFFRHVDVHKAIEGKLVTMKVKYICIAGDAVSGLSPVCLSLNCTLHVHVLVTLPFSYEAVVQRGPA